MNDDDVDENLNGFVIIIISRPFFVLFEGYSNIYCTGKLGIVAGAVCFVRIFQKVPQLPRPHSILIGIGEVLTEMGRELPLVVVDNRFGILAENPRLRINNTSLLHQSFFSSFMICFSIDGDGEVTHLHFRREGLNRHGCRTVYEAI
jgi:hypothetical protein